MHYMREGIKRGSEMIAEIKMFLARILTPAHTRHQQDQYEATNQMIAVKQAIWFRTQMERKVKLKEEIKNLQLRIIIAKKQKKRTSDMYRDMARIQAEVLRLEAM